MKVIDLLNKIANGEEVPERIQVYSDIFVFENSNNIYEHEETRTNLLSIYNGNILNYKVEIIKENKKIENIDLSEWAEITYQEDWEMFTKDFNRNCNLFVNKINEIIKVLNESKN